MEGGATAQMGSSLPGAGSSVDWQGARARMMQGTMRWRVPRPGWIAALAAGAALRGFFALHHPRFMGDTLVYGELAHNLLAHHVYGLNDGHIRPTLIRLPGYPLFLAACFVLFGTANYVAVVWLQVALDLLGCVLLGALASRLFGRRVGMVAIWLAALCPFTANYAAAPLTETPSIFCVVLGFWGLARWLGAVRAGQPGLEWAACVGVAITAATLLRPDGGLLAAALVPAMLWAAWRRGAPARRWRSWGLGGAVLASAMLTVALGLWAARNWQVFHVVQPLAPKYANDPDELAPLGFARWYRTWAVGFGDTVNVYWTYDGSPLALSYLPTRAFDDPAQRRETAALYARYNEVQTATPEIDAAFARLAAERVRAHPVRFYGLLPLAKLADMWLRPRTELMKLPLDWWRVRAHPRRSAFEIAYAAPDWALLLLAVAGLVRWRRRGWGEYGPVAFAAVAFVLMRSAMLLTIDNSEPRYTLECFPVVLLLASLAVAAVRNADSLRE